MGGETEGKSAFLRKEALDEDDLKASAAERRQRVEDELCELQERCRKAGLSPKQVRECAKPFLECSKRKERMRFLKGFFWCSLTVAAVAGIFANQTTSDCVTTHMRLFAIRVSHWKE